MTETGTLPCPGCGRPFVRGSAACPSCDLRLHGHDAARLWQVDQELAALGRERTELLHRLRTADAASPAPVPTAPAGPAPSTPAAPGPLARDRTPQQLLLGTGALLLLVAAVVFVAVAWRLLGLVGQVVLLLVLTALALVGSVRLDRRGLTSSAEWVGLLGVGLLVVDLVAARERGLGGLAEVPAQAWFSGTALLVAGVAAGVGVLAPRLRCYPLATTAGLWLGVLAAVGLGGAARAAVALLLAGLALASPLTRAARSSFARSERPWVDPGWWPAVGSVVLAAVVATVVLSESGSSGGALGGAVVVVVGALLVLGAATRALRTGEALVGGGAVPALAVWAVAGAEAALLLRRSGVLAPLVAVVVAAGAVVVLAVPRAGAAGYRPHARAVALGLGVTATGYVLAHGRPDLSALATGVVTAAAVAVALLSRRYRVHAEVTAVVAAVGTTGFVLQATSAGVTVLVAAYVLLAAVLAALAASRRGSVAEEVVLGAGAVLAAGVAVLAALDHHEPELLGGLGGGAPVDGSAELLAGVLVAAAVLAFGYACLPGRGALAAVGVPLATAGYWVLLAEHDVRPVELWTLPVAALCLTVGAITHLRGRRAGASPSSWLTWGPGAAVGLLPSAVLAGPDGHAARVVLVLLAAAAVLGVGARARSQAPLVVGAVALVVVAVLQLGPVAAALPRWLTLGAVGVVLLWAGVRYERHRVRARSAADWFSALS